MSKKRFEIMLPAKCIVTVELWAETPEEALKMLRDRPYGIGEETHVEVDEYKTNELWSVYDDEDFIMRG